MQACSQRLVTNVHNLRTQKSRCQRIARVQVLCLGAHLDDFFLCPAIAVRTSSQQQSCSANSSRSTPSLRHVLHHVRKIAPPSDHVLAHLHPISFHSRDKSKCTQRYDVRFFMKLELKKASKHQEHVQKNRAPLPQSDEYTVKDR